MKKPIADAVEAVRLAFPKLTVNVEELDDGCVWVVLNGVGIGTGWNRSSDDLRVKLHPTFPDTEPYPFYVAAGLARTDGQQFAPVQPAVQLDGETWTQVSLKKNGIAPGTGLLQGEDLGTRIEAVVRWLRSPR